ncbi:MAG: hypothetical protein M3R36_13015 [Bacteroidota bacterium]|nr:hypothetical protein [Bacteroidota bacterium]
MEQIKFKTKIKTGSIKIPSKYKELENTEVNVAITSEQTGYKRKIKIINPYKNITDKKKYPVLKKL